MEQSTRMETLDKFKSGFAKYMVCSDVAARGLDMPQMSHVFNFDVPTHPDDYVHRIGRTGRAGRKGLALTIATEKDKKFVDAVQKFIGEENRHAQDLGTEQRLERDQGAVVPK